MIQLNATIEQWSENIFIGKVKEFKGLVVQEDSIESTKSTLLKAIRVKIAFDYKLPIENIHEASQSHCQCDNFIETTSPNKYVVSL